MSKFLISYEKDHGLANTVDRHSKAKYLSVALTVGYGNLDIFKSYINTWTGLKSGMTGCSRSEAVEKLKKPLAWNDLLKYWNEDM